VTIYRIVVHIKILCIGQYLGGVVAKVLGFGGVFLKVENPKDYCQWYKDARMAEM